MEHQKSFVMYYLALVAIASSLACAPTGVGDPCEPEVLPDGGFNENDMVVEASSLQCRTRICMRFHGIDFCTKRCETDEDCNADWYEEGAGDGDIPPAYCRATVTVGRPGMLGTYCVPTRALNATE